MTDNVKDLASIHAEVSTWEGTFSCVPGTGSCIGAIPRLEDDHIEVVHYRQRVEDALTSIPARKRTISQRRLYALARHHDVAAHSIEAAYRARGGKITRPGHELWIRNVSPLSEPWLNAPSQKKHLMPTVHVFEAFRVFYRWCIGRRP